MATIYYEIATGLHRGSEAIKEILPDAEALNSVELDALGWVKGVIPTIGVRYSTLNMLTGN